GLRLRAVDRAERRGMRVQRTDDGEPTQQMPSMNLAAPGQRGLMQKDSGVRTAARLLGDCRDGALITRAASHFHLRKMLQFPQGSTPAFLCFGVIPLANGKVETLLQNGARLLLFTHRDIGAPELNEVGEAAGIQIDRL